MADILDMISYRQLQRQRIRFKRDLDTLEHHPTWAPKGEAELTDIEKSYANFDGPETAFRMGNDGKVTEAPVPGKSLADVIPFGPAKAKRAATLTGRYLDEILEKAYDGSEWAQFRLALIQITDEPPDEQVYIMQETFPEMDPRQFHIWLDRAIEEFHEYSDLMEENDQP